MSYFVFAEFGNEEVLDFLRRMRTALAGDSISSPIHVTLRGPYENPPSMAELEDLAAVLPGYGVKISSHGYFSTPKGFSVFLRAECSVFRQIWDKPDYRVPLARIEPHITIYESASRARARQVLDFLKREKLLIHTYNLYLSIYESKARQIDMFGLPDAIPKSKPLSRDLWRIPNGILKRARDLGVQLSQASTGDV